MENLSLFVAIASLAFAAYASGEDIKLPLECIGKSYCTTKPAGYAARMGDIDRFTKENKYWAGLSAKNSYLDEWVPTIKYDDVNCGYIEQVEQPYVISAKLNTTNPNHKYVVQTEYFKQKIKTRKCVQKELSCFDDLKALQPKIDTYCDETYASMTLFVFEDGSIHPQLFQIPVACTCKVQYKSMNK